MTKLFEKVHPDMLLYEERVGQVFRGIEEAVIAVAYRRFSDMEIVNILHCDFPCILLFWYRQTAVCYSGACLAALSVFYASRSFSITMMFSMHLPSILLSIRRSMLI